MFQFQPIAIAVLTGFISGLLLSIPVGPINLTIMNEGARRGFYWAVMIGFGATVMEVIYCSIAFTGFASLFQAPIVKISMELFSFFFMLVLGLKFLTARSLPSAYPMQDRFQANMQPQSAFMIGLVRVMGNLGVLLFWIILATSFINHEWVEPNKRGKLACITGVAIGTGLWFFALSWAASLGHKRFSQRTLLRMEHFSGIGLLILASVHGLRMLWELTHPKL